MYYRLYLGFVCGRDYVQVRIFSINIRSCVSVHVCTISKNVRACAYAIFHACGVRERTYTIFHACASAKTLACTYEFLCVHVHYPIIILARGGCTLCLSVILSNKPWYATLCADGLQVRLWLQNTRYFPWEGCVDGEVGVGEG